MRVICISNIEEDKELDLVVGKVYEIQSQYISTENYEKIFTYYLIKSNEPNEFTYYDMNLFMPLDKWRELQLNEIGIA